MISLPGLVEDIFDGSLFVTEAFANSVHEAVKSTGPVVGDGVDVGHGSLCFAERSW